MHLHHRLGRRTRKSKTTARGTGHPNRRPLKVQSLEARYLLAGTTNFATGAELRNYRLAIATTEEYTAAIGGEAAALASVTKLVDDINQIYEKELAIHFDLVTGTNTIFEPGDNDGLTNGNLGALINETTGVLDGVIGSAAYDIGHVLGTFAGGGISGLAYLGVVGSNTLKGGGGTVVGDINSVGGEGWTLVIAHEFGHQFDAGHTFNASVAGTNCNSGSRDASSAYEPASGSTIMSYAGICGANNLQNSEDPVFHSASFEDINAYMGTARGGPNSTTAISNDVPSVDAGSDYTIPAETPFSLTAVGTDSDALTYSWEQLDLGPPQSLPISDLGSGPIFRAFAPTDDPVRIFPRLEDQLAGVNTAQKGEVLPTTNRALNFRATVRDDKGGVASDDVVVTVVDTPMPFSVTSHSAGTNLMGGTVQSITWDVGGTDTGAIGVANVAIDLSVDGGLTYPYTLLSSTANDGSENITLPNINAGQARYRVSAVGNIFFDINDSDFSITADLTLPGIQLTETDGDTRPVEANTAGFEDTYDITLNTNPGGNVVIDIATDGETLVSSDGVNFASTTQLTFNTTTAQTVYVRGVADNVEEGPHQSLISHSVATSTSADYSAGDGLGFLQAMVVDVDLGPVIGIDFDFWANPPENWQSVGFLSQADGTNLMRDDGAATMVDISSTIFGSSGASSPGPASSTVPRHIPSLTDLDAYSYNQTTNSFTSTWSDLTPGQEYGVYIFGYENRAQTYINDVTLTGANTVTFLQTLTNGNLYINDSVGSSSEKLDSYRKLVTADASGEIDITIVRGAGSDGVSLAGLALQPIYDLTPVDFGDAPDSYGTRSVDNGPTHQIVGPRLGAQRDDEVNGIPDADALGDDNDGTPDDEDGVVFGAIGANSGLAALNLTMENAATAKVDAWIDFNKDGDWDDSGEQILTNVTVAQVTQTLNFAVPDGITAGDTYARVRLSTAGGLSPTGPADDGEVEDYKITIQANVDPVVVESVSVNNGDAQRAQVTSIKVNFNQIVDAPDSAFTLRHRGDDTDVSTLAITTDNSSGKSVVEIKFDPGDKVHTRTSVDNSLEDGNYDLTVDSSQIVGTTAGPIPMLVDFVFGNIADHKLYRFFGDQDGDRDNDGQDLGFFGDTFQTSLANNPTEFDTRFDFDGDNDIDGQDLGQFGDRFQGDLPFA